MINKLKAYNQFMFESILNESVIYYDTRLYNILTKISKMSDIQWDTTAKSKKGTENATIISREDVQKLCKDILDKAYTETDSNILLIDINDNNTITYTKGNTIKTEEDKEKLLNIETNPSKNKIDELKDLVNNKPKESIKIGKFIKSLGLNYSQVTIDEFIKRVYNYNKSYNELSNFDLKVVSGDEIPHWYSIKNCVKKDLVDNINKLHETCMVTVPPDYFDIYKDNPDSVQLIITTIDNKLASRALIWKTDKGMFVDTVYSANQGGLDKIQEFITKGDYITDKNVEMIVNLEVIPDLDSKLPYIDTFCYMDQEKKILSNKDLHSIRIQDNFGGFSIEIDGDYIKSDSLVYGITKSGTNGYIKKSLAVYSDELEVYIDDRIVVETDDDEVYHIYSDNIVQLNTELYGDSEYMLNTETTTDYIGRIIAKEDVSYVLNNLKIYDNDNVLSMKQDVIMNIFARKSEKFIDVSEIKNKAWYKFYVKFFGEFDYINIDILEESGDSFILQKYSNVEFVKVDDEVITLDIANAYSFKHGNIFKRYDIFNIFEKLKVNGNILNIDTNDLVNRIDKDSKTYEMLKDVSLIKKTSKYKKQKLD